MDSVIERVRAANPAVAEEFDQLAYFDGLRLAPKRRRRRRPLLALPALAAAAAAAVTLLVALPSAPSAAEVAARASAVVDLSGGEILYAETNANRVGLDGSTSDYGIRREWVLQVAGESDPRTRFLQVKGIGDGPAGYEEISKPGFSERYKPDTGKVERVDGMQSVPGEIFRVGSLLKAADVRMTDEGDAYVLRWREKRPGPPIEYTLWVDRDSYAPLKFVDHSWGTDVEGKPFDETFTETVQDFQRLPDTPENRKLLDMSHSG